MVTLELNDAELRLLRAALNAFLADFGHEIFIVHLWGDEDRKPSHNGELELEDAETGQVVEMAFDRIAREQYLFDGRAPWVQAGVKGGIVQSGIKRLRP